MILIIAFILPFMKFVLQCITQPYQHFDFQANKTSNQFLANSFQMTKFTFYFTFISNFISFLNIVYFLVLLS